MPSSPEWWPLGAKWWRRIHMTLTIAWAIMLPVAIITGWIFSIAFISACSIYANFIGHGGAWQATRAEEVSE